MLFWTGELPAKQLFMIKKRIISASFILFLTFSTSFTSEIEATQRPLDVTIEDKTQKTALLSEGEYRISAYDNIMRAICEEQGNDWRLMSAIAYHESRFMPHVVSHQGARGLMQIMPIVARNFNTPLEQVEEPETNILLANKLYNTIEKSLDLPETLTTKDRMSLILASYNSGIGHVKDARRLAIANGENHNSWEVVSHYLRLKSDPQYYTHQAVRCGRFSGARQTLAYVDNVIGHYSEYCQIAEL